MPTSSLSKPVKGDSNYKRHLLLLLRLDEPDAGQPLQGLPGIRACGLESGFRV